MTASLGMSGPGGMFRTVLTCPSARGDATAASVAVKAKGKTFMGWLIQVRAEDFLGRGQPADSSQLHLSSADAAGI